jgi:iron(III) transport system permease protein
MRCRDAIRGLVGVGYIMPPYLSALAYIILLGPDAGYVNRFVAWSLGLRHGPFDVFSLGGVTFVIGLHVMAFPFFLTESALASLDAPLEEAAQVLGATRFAVTLRITLPLVAPAITGGALLAAVDSMALFGPQALLGLPAQLVFLPTRIYGLLGAYPPRWPDASGLSLILVLLTVAALVVQRHYLERRAYVTVGGRGVRARRWQLGPWRWVVLVLCVVVVTLAAIAPVAVLAIASVSRNWTEALTPTNFTLAHYADALFDNQIALRGIVNSFQLAFGAATITGVLGLLIAYIDQRTTLPGRRLLDYLAVIPLGLPGTVMAVGMLQAFIRPPLPIYGTIWILLACYIARFVPLAVRSAQASLAQIDPALEEAARVIGAGWFTTMRTVLLPLIRSGLLAGFLLVFIPALTELSATILLYTGGTETIAVAIFRLNDLGQLEVVAALSVFTIAVVLVVTLLLRRLARGGVQAGFG